ncbi:MAG: hypothetical protein AAGE52_02565 [Myxococcota bacterium]
MRILLVCLSLSLGCYASRLDAPDEFDPVDPPPVPDLPDPGPEEPDPDPEVCAPIPFEVRYNDPTTMEPVVEPTIFRTDALVAVYARESSSPTDEELDDFLVRYGLRLVREPAIPGEPTDPERCLYEFEFLSWPGSLEELSARIQEINDDEAIFQVAGVTEEHWNFTTDVLVSLREGVSDEDFEALVTDFGGVVLGRAGDLAFVPRAGLCSS